MEGQVAITCEIFAAKKESCSEQIHESWKTVNWSLSIEKWKLILRSVSANEQLLLIR